MTPSGNMSARTFGPGVVAALAFGLGGSAYGQSPAYGTVIVFNDEWPLRNEGFSYQPQSANTFIANFCAQQDPSNGVSVLVYSGYMGGWEGETLRARLAANGASVTVNTNPGITLSEMLQHDAVILCGALSPGGFPNNQPIVEFVSAGGNALFMGGTGYNGDDAQLFNTALNAFGLAFNGPTNQIVGTIAIGSSDPFFLGVQGLWQANGNNILLHGPNSPAQLLALVSPGNALYAISRAPYSDCDGDGIPNFVEIRAGAADINGNGIPDTCDCPADINKSGTIDAEDLAYVLFAWGMTGGKAGGADINGDAIVDANDLSLVLGSWGPCPN